MKILILSHQGIGDIIMSFPIYNAIREKFPNAIIYSTVKSMTEAELLRDQCLSDEFILSDYYHMSLYEKISWIWSLLFLRFDLVVSPFKVNYLKSILIRVITLSKKMVIHKDSSSRLLGMLSQNVLVHQSAKSVHNNQQIASLFSDTVFLPSLRPGAVNSISMSEVFTEKYDCIIGIHPGCGEVEKHKRWPVERYIELINLLVGQQKKILFMLFGVKSEVELCNEIINGVNDNVSIRSFCGKKTISETISLVAKCTVFVSGDSGLMHVASALNVKTYSVYGPTTHLTTSPYWNHGEVIRASLPCSPCYPDRLTGCGNPICMSSVSASAVFDKISEIKD